MEVWKRWKQEEIDQKDLWRPIPTQSHGEEKKKVNKEHIKFAMTLFYLILGLGFGFVVAMIQLILRIKL